MFRKRKPPTKSVEFELTGPQLDEYFEHRFEYLSQVSAEEIQIAKDLENLVNKNLERFERKAQLIITESNEFERQHTGFFAIAISFIIAGLLNVIPTEENTSCVPDAHTSRSCRIFEIFERECQGKWLSPFTPPAARYWLVIPRILTISISIPLLP